MTVQELFTSRNWKPIPNCPGRYVLVNPEPVVRPEQLAGVDCTPAEFRVKAAKDPVLVLPLKGGGLITYRHADGRYLHTLNNEEGFRRKLAQLGITMPDQSY